LVDLFRSFLPPDPAPLTVNWPRPPDDVAEQLGSAAAKHSYAAPDVDAPLLFRLGGSVRGRVVLLTATPFIQRGVRSRGLELAIEGEISPTATGSRLDGVVRASVPRWALVLVVAFLAFVTWEGGLFALLVSSVVLGVTTALALPRYQRAELRTVDQLAAALARV
jgi:hypothetical protein